MPLVPIQWLREHTDVPESTTAAQLAKDLVKVGLEEEEIHTSGITGPLVVGRVLERIPEPQKNGKTINWCQVDVGPDHAAADGGPRGIVCGAHNFNVGDSVVVSLPGAVLPGDFAIAARKTYGHISDGMICSQRELGLGDDHDGIIVLEDAPAPGSDAIELLGLGEEILEINVTPDRGYCFSMRGIAREYAHSTGAAFRDPAAAITVPESTTDAIAVTVHDAAPIHGVGGCDRFVARIVRGIDPNAATPEWMVRRLRQAGMRPISLTVDVTNYVMLDLGQPLHAYDLEAVTGPIVVRRAGAGEKFTTLDDVERTLDAEDLVISDSFAGPGSRVLGLAGVMGGAETEVSETTTAVLIEAAHFDPVSVARTARRHKLPSEAAKRNERGVDPQLADVAAQRVVDLLVEFAGGVADAAATDLDRTKPPAAITLDASLPSRMVGVDYSPEQVAETLRSLGAHVSEAEEDDDGGRRARRSVHFSVVPPSWRPDLTTGSDLVEEVVRLRGYDQIPSILPTAPAGGRGLTSAQKRRRAVAQLAAADGLVQVLTYPFVAAKRFDELGYDQDDPRRAAISLVNPISEAQPLMRTSVLATLADAALRNIGRGLTDLAIYEIGSVTLGDGHTHASPLPQPAALPSPADLDAVRAAVPTQEQHVAGILAGNRTLPGVLATAAGADYADAIEIAQHICRTYSVAVTVRPSAEAPFHPGRCAEFVTESGRIVGHAGELAPKVIQALGLPARTVAFELSLDGLGEEANVQPHQFRPVSAFPAAKEDIALVVDASVAAADLMAVIEQAGGDVLEEVRLFDQYTSDALGADRKSLAFSLRLRAADRTLTSKETAGVREQIVAAAQERFGAELRS